LPTTTPPPQLLPVPPAQRLLEQPHDGRLGALPPLLLDRKLAPDGARELLEQVHHLRRRLGAQLTLAGELIVQPPHLRCMPSGQVVEATLPFVSLLLNALDDLEGRIKNNVPLPASVLYCVAAI